jgi:hypothetical protein
MYLLVVLGGVAKKENVFLTACVFAVSSFLGYNRPSHDRRLRFIEIVVTATSIVWSIY